MPQYGFPADDYTPHGYLANPYAVAHSWSHGDGGCLRSSRTYLGVGWQLPWALRAEASADLIVVLERGDQQHLVTRADFAGGTLFSPHHSSTLLTYRWQAFGLAWDASYVLIDADRLGLQVIAAPLPSAENSDRTGPVRLTIWIVGWRQSGGGIQSLQADRNTVDLGEPFGRFQLLADHAFVQQTDGQLGLVAVPRAEPVDTGPHDAEHATVALTLDVDPDAQTTLCAVARRRRDADNSQDGDSAPALVGEAIGRARNADAACWSKAARLVGDWPDHWRRGWVYDIETTRMCVYPSGGVFTDVWPSWMIQWPRAVVAEGTLDMARLAYADPQLALRATLSLFRDAPADNVPCIFQHGEPNMVAKDGSVCGTSPAWCVPFYNLERLYLRTLDREWLAEIYPYLVRYVEFWLRERTDAEGWAVYKCTWEAGEDDTPRLDPERRGDNVVSEYVRPVELQAMMALSAGVLARFAGVLGRTEDTARWREVEAAYAERTRQLWDADAGRFRDWDSRAGAFLAPSAPGETNYWGIDPCRYSALAFTPVLAGLVDEGHVGGLRRELLEYGRPPWTLWASWSYVVLEAAKQLGSGSWAGHVAASIVDRVYLELDAREIAAPSHPTPGVAREYWPLDLDSWASCEAYGWGANTATLLMRQIIGFWEGPDEDGDHLTPGAPSWKAGRLRFILEPCLPDALLEPGRTYRVANLPYRGAQLDIGYRVESPRDGGQPARLTLLLSADVPTALEASASDGEARTILPPAARHEVPFWNEQRAEVTLLPAPGPA